MNYGKHKRAMCSGETNKTFIIASGEKKKKTQSHESVCLYMTEEIGRTADKAPG